MTLQKIACPHCEAFTGSKKTENHYVCKECGHEWNPEETMKDHYGTELLDGNTVEILECDDSSCNASLQGKQLTNIKLAPETNQIIAINPGNGYSRFNLKHLKIKKVKRPNEPLGIWTWAESHQDVRMCEITTADIKYIRDLVVVWDVAELGAPVLATKENDWLQDNVFEDDRDKEMTLGAFLSAAKLPSTTRTINNPYFDSANTIDVEEGTEGLTDKVAVKRLKTEKQITLEIDNTLQKIWDTSYLHPYGFEQKRGFISEDFKQIVDSNQQRSRGELIKLKKSAKGNLFLYLQLFVQQAVIETGVYHTKDNHNWYSGEPNILQKINKEHWYNRISSEFYRNTYYDFLQEEDFKEFIKKAQITKDKTSIDFPSVAKICNFYESYQYNKDSIYRQDIDIIDILLTGLSYFTEDYTLDKNNNFCLTLTAVRILNITGKHQEALNLLEKANLNIFNNEDDTFFETSSAIPIPAQIAYFEGAIANTGLDINSDAFKKVNRYFKATKEHLKHELPSYINDEDTIEQDLTTKGMQNYYGASILLLSWQMQLIEAIRKYNAKLK